MLRHSTDSKPGITREKNGLGWAYFAPEGKHGIVHEVAISSADVNTYPREASGGDFTAKSFRTWRVLRRHGRVAGCRAPR
ncbi:hypothetical protein [Sphingomonas sp.]|uniref:hypothetical protein n=1 Tax=Sphingomonas sp. TaxID=28214 RepID=UPI003751291B